MPDSLVHLTLDGPVATVTLDSPHNRNALSRQLFADLERQVNAAIAAPTSRVVVITGTGTVFCSGADLKEQREANERGEQTGPGALVPILEAIMDAPKPVIARVNGAARAGGVGLLAACDIAVAIDTATFAFSEVRIGVAPAVISVVVIPRMGLVKSRELMLTGNTFDAAEAMRSGLLNAVAPADGLDAAVAAYVDAFLAAAPGALAETKAILRRVPGMSSDEAFPYVSELSARLFAGEEALEGFTAFAEKRPPRWAERG
ncbi:MAG: enoyl-CoA hydratase-related protein [Dehalococcoidia bacterium]